MSFVLKVFGLHLSDLDDNVVKEVGKYSETRRLGSLEGERHEWAVLEVGKELVWLIRTDF